MLTTPAPSFIPFTCPVSVTPERSWFSFRLVSPGAEYVSHTVALGTTIGEPSDPWVGPEWARGRARMGSSGCDQPIRRLERPGTIVTRAVAAPRATGLRRRRRQAVLPPIQRHAGNPCPIPCGAGPPRGMGALSGLIHPISVL